MDFVIAVLDTSVNENIDSKVERSTLVHIVYHKTVKDNDAALDDSNWEYYKMYHHYLYLEETEEQY